MKIRALKSDGLAINCREIVYFKKGDILQAADGKLAEVNILRLVELDLAVEIKDGEQYVEKTQKDNATLLLPGDNTSSDGTDNSTNNHAGSVSGIDESLPYYRRIEDKTELDNYAKEQYKIHLDRRMTIERMRDQLEYQINQLEKGK